MDLFAGIERSDDIDEDTDDGERYRTQSRAGWNLFCNDRRLAADKSPLTGEWRPPPPLITRNIASSADTSS